jgi:uncharacterized membrane protein YcaP (DUF421 family)
MYDIEPQQRSTDGRPYKCILSPNFGKLKRGDLMLLSYIRTILLYLVLIGVVRLMGKRQIGQMEPAEFVVTMLVANLAAIPMQDGGIPLYSGLVPILTVLGVELVLSGLCLRWVWVRRLLCGKPVILIDHGKILRQNLRRTRITLDELTELLRQKDVLKVETVAFAILETNGNLSVFPDSRFQPAPAEAVGISLPPQRLPYTVISDGVVCHSNLFLAGLDEKWLNQYLQKKKTTIKDTFLMTVDENHDIFWQGMKENG